MHPPHLLSCFFFVVVDKSKSYLQAHICIDKELWLYRIDIANYFNNTGKPFNSLVRVGSSSPLIIFIGNTNIVLFILMVSKLRL